uniref:Short-chain dehydrogenase n=1 Tax=Candidatus Kentrum sp. MB TaxID=2138164 RepID=A0A450XF26_9GAMM|nr:MAG: Short-chain dehydrogenase [Candidatus Kentron sp. MB]VFK27839.1 MAG: Short-chain dehydrogenase [Candidatus Kentron sp. MB]VFK74437.1 MAG: Short-chain dehydrogenase [Candidatus Kentron sp. MB]
MSTILITGANRGIGLEAVRQYAEDGWTVLACCRSPNDAHELHGLAKKSDGGIELYPLDVTDAERRAELASRLEGRPIDILLNNAGISGGWNSQGFGQCQTDIWLEVFHTNVIGAMLMTQAFVENIAASERKIVANMSSILGSISKAGAFQGDYLYRSSKAALNMVNVCCAHDLAERGITVVALHPGWVRTDMGGPDATLSVQESVTKLRNNLAQITFSDSGRFIGVDGATIPW